MLPALPALVFLPAALLVEGRLFLLRWWIGLAAASLSVIGSTSRSRTSPPLSMLCRHLAIRAECAGLVPSGSVKPLGSSVTSAGTSLLRRKFRRPFPKLRVATSST